MVPEELALGGFDLDPCAHQCARREAARAPALGLFGRGWLQFHRRAPCPAAANQQAADRPHTRPLAVHGTAAAAEFRPELLPHAAPAGALDGPGRPQALCRPRSAGAAAVPAPAVGVSDVQALDTRRLNGAAAPRLVQLPLPLSRRTRRRSFVRPVPGEQPSRSRWRPGRTAPAVAVHAGHCLGGVAAGRRQDRDARRGACPASPRDLSARDGERRPMPRRPTAQHLSAGQRGRCVGHARVRRASSGR
jgi:hypothetical protein